MFGDDHARSHELGTEHPTDLATNTGTNTGTDTSAEYTATSGVDLSAPEALDEASVEAAAPEEDPVALVPTPPVTGDEAVDEAMMRLAESQAGSFAERIESGEHAHRSLQSRLGGLGGA